MNLKKINLMVVLLSLFFITCTKASIPNPPTFVGKIIIGDTIRISLKDNSDNELGFRVYKEDGTLYQSFPSHDTEDHIYMQFVGLIPCKVYKFKVVVFNNEGESSPPLEIIIKIPGMECIDLPDAPGLYIGRWNITDTSARISFKDNSDDELGFRVYDRDKGTLLLTVPSHNEKTHPYQYANLTGLIPCRLYRLKVVAFNDKGESDSFSIPKESFHAFKTKGCDTCPMSPNLYIGRYNITQTTARISFQDNSNNETGFKVYIINMDTDAVIHTVLIESKEGIGSYQYKTLENLTPDTLYRLNITSFNESCESTNTVSCCGVRNKFRTLP